MAVRDLSGIPRSADPILDFLSGKMASLGPPGPATPVMLALGGQVFVSGEGIVSPPASLRRAAAGALVSGRWCRGKAYGESLLLRGSVRPLPFVLLLPACLAPEREALLHRIEQGIIPAALERDPLLVTKCASPGLWEPLRPLGRIARSPLPVLVLGETGTGKEVVARALHRASGRPGTFVAENCAALPESLLEAELFGARRGAYTGAARDRRGRILEAAGGTLLLDEIGDLPLPLQAKLLRVLQEKKIRPLGADRAVAVDIRFVAATHRDLPRWCRQGRFRPDLYYRLAGAVVELPALRHRRGDIPPLVALLLARAAGEGLSPGRYLAQPALEELLDRPYPGNVRELDNLLRQAVVLADSPVIGRDLVTALARENPLQPNLEMEAIHRALTVSGGVKSAAARRLGWSRQKLYRRLGALGMEA